MPGLDDIELAGNVQPQRFLDFPSTPSAKRIEEAEEQIVGNLARAIEYTAQFVPQWRCYADMYANRRKFNELLPLSSSGMHTKPKNAAIQSWRSQEVVATAPAIDTRVQAMMKSIFANSEYFNVLPDVNSQESIEDSQYPTSRKIQAFLIESLDRMQIKSRIHEALRDSLVFGTAVGKVSWHEDIELVEELDLATGELTTKKVPRNQAVALNILKLNRVLPDPDARNSDCQQWEFCGDYTYVPYSVIASRFGTKDRPGPYNINKQQFFREWPEHGQPLSASLESGIGRDDDDLSEDTVVTYLKVWEYHGRIYYKNLDVPVESVATVITDVSAPDPRGGVLVRLQDRPALDYGMRPYLFCHGIPRSGPFGMGLIEANMDLIWVLSHCINLYIDCTRFLAVPMYKYKQGRPFATEHAGGQLDLLYPGRGIPFANDPGEIMPFSLEVSQLHTLVQLIQHLQSSLEARFSAADIFSSYQPRRTASEFVGQMQRAQQPIESALLLVREALLNPLAKMAIRYFQKRISEDQTIWLPSGVGNVPVASTLTLSEIQTGRYRVEAVLDIPEAAKTSKAMAVIQALGILENQAMPLLLVENVWYKRAGLIEELLRLMGISDIAPVLQRVDEETKRQLLATMLSTAAAPTGPSGNERAQVPEQQAAREEPANPMIKMITPDARVGSNIPPELKDFITKVQADAQVGGPVPLGVQEV